MGAIKKWSTGKIGNSYSDHTSDGNPNSKGLDTDGLPGLEGYIEEDEVVAYTDNRPLKNLAENDGILSQNITDTASEVDNGVFKSKYETFDLTIQSQDYYSDPETDDSIFINKLKVASGSAIINGQVTRIGNQKLMYFYRDDDSNSILFPDYDSNSDSTQIQIYDDDYFKDETARTFGGYTPVYSTITDDLPKSYDDYEVIITQRDTKNTSSTNITVYNMYRDWEDIIPFKAHSQAVSNESVSFNSDLNFGQDSDGYWLSCGKVPNTRVSDVQIEKDIIVKDKAISASEFVKNGAEYVKSIVTDGLFFKDLKWSTSQYFDNYSDIQDLYVDSNNTVYLIQRSSENTRLFRLTSNSTQLETKDLGTPSGSANLGIRVIGNYLMIMTTSGWIDVWDMTEAFADATPSKMVNLSTSQNIRDIYEWDGKVWIAGDTTLWYTSSATFNPASSTFTAINLNTYLIGEDHTSVISHVNRLIEARGNYSVSSALTTNVVNLLQNSSFEDGGTGNTPSKWTLAENSAGSTASIVNNVKYNGNYSVLLTKSSGSSYCSLVQSADITDVATSYTLSAYMRTNIATSDPVILYVYELDASGNILNSSNKSFTLTTDFARYSLTHTVTSSSVAKIKVEVRSEITVNTTESVYIDAIQLETGTTVNEYVESFDYLLIAFRKKSTDTYNTPFALIDRNDPYNIKYVDEMYGNIESINDITAVGHNKFMFVSDKNVWNLTFLNNRNEYNRFTITKLIDNDNINYNTIKKYECIKKVGDKIYYGGIVDNRVIKISSTTTGSHTITISDASAGAGESLLTLLGGYTEIAASNSRNESAQFNRMAPCYEAEDNKTSAGKYMSSGVYSFKVMFDEDTTTAKEISITAPSANDGPWTMDAIYNQLNKSTNVLPTGLEWSSIDATTAFITPEWYKVSSSVTVNDGFYSTNGNNNQTYIRGNIHSIFLASDNSTFYIAKDGQIFKSKVDSNLLKVDNSYVSYNWELGTDGYSLDEYNSVADKEIEFTDDNKNRTWVDLNIGDGYSLLPGSLRVKTTTGTETGYRENIDYFVDYDNAKIIRSKNTNYLSNSDFSTLNGTFPAGWNYQTNNSTNSKASQYTLGTEFSKYAIKMFKGSSSTTSILYQNNSASSITGVSNFQVGDTFTYSVYLQADIAQTANIRLVECVSGTNDSSFDDSKFASNAISKLNCSVPATNKWVRFSISHTIQSATSNVLRVEINANSIYQMLVAKPQLELNPVATPYVNGIMTSDIDPDENVWIDFIRVKELSAGTDFIFDTTNRTIKLESTPNTNSTYYLKYKYTKIFNPYKFGDSIPTTDIVDYTDNDDYFLYENEGHVWAINQNFALLSLDTINPLKISYKYHYPRIDLLKIRNNPDKYGNYLYLVKGTYNSVNPYRPVDVGLTTDRYVYDTDIDDISDLTNTTYFNNDDNDVLYEINVTSDDYTKNDIYDRRIYINAKSHTLFNISLYPETIAYFPFLKDFNSTSGLSPLNTLKSSKIIPIIKNYNVSQNAEVGAYNSSYQYSLRNNSEMVFPATTFSIFVDPISGSDSNNGESPSAAVKTVTKALELSDSLRCNIIITKAGIISENVEVNKAYKVSIFADTYCYWQGGLQNDTELSIQGIWFQNTNIYAEAKLNLFFCTFENAVVNCYTPQTVNIYNCEFDDCHNSIIRVKDVLFPSPFTHPYERFALRDDGIAANPASNATSDNESIAPGDSYYNSSLASQPEGAYSFHRCLIHDCTDTMIEYDPTYDWVSSFYFEYCTIANNVTLFTTEKANLTIQIENSILYNNKASSDSKIVFDCASNITFYNCFIDFSATNPETDYNANSGTLINRDACIGATDDADPGFIGTVNSVYDYHLKSLAKGSTTDSVCLDKGDSGDIGVYDETREQEDKTLPKKLKSYVAYIGEGIVYPVTLNSEKITFTLEFKPTGSTSSSGIILDTRSSSDDEDFIALVYNNNDDDDVSLTASAGNSTSNPYRFRVIVANKEKKYSVVSPIKITTDEQFQIWHKISFTINYEEIYNTKSSFVEKDRKQNIITLYHNDTVSIESFVKYDLNRYIDGDLLTGLGNTGTNAWNFNTICQFITLGSDYNDENKMIGYYTELRIDNRFIDRKQFEMWNEKVVPFNDPMSYVNQKAIGRALDTTTLSEYWSLRSKADIGAKGTKFASGSAKKFFYDDGNLVWALTRSSNNLFTNGAFTGVTNASVVAANIIDWSTSFSMVGAISFKTTNSRLGSDNTGFSITLINVDKTGYPFTSQTQLEDALTYALSKINTLISFEFTSDGKLRFFTKDWGVSGTVQLSVTFNASDYAKLGFAAATVSGVRSFGSYFVSGINLTNVSSTNLANGNNIWNAYDDECTEFGTNIIRVHKNNSDASISEDLITLYQKISLSITNSTYYTLSVYINTDEYISSNVVKAYWNGAAEDFDDITRYKGNWWLCSKVVDLDTALTNASIGVEFLKEGDYVIGGIQLENRSFVAPFAENYDSTNGKLIIPKNRVNTDSGVITFKFKPLFDFYDTTPKYIMECLGVTDDVIDANAGFKITYNYNTKKKRGIMSFFINGTNAEWDLELIDKFWNQWHTCIINYDFNINRYVFWFDYYNNTIEDSLKECNYLSDLYIGSGVSGVSGDRTDAVKTSDMLVKDIIITNYPVTDTETQNWVNAYEFYNEGLIVNAIDAYKDQVEEYVNTANNTVSVTNNLISTVDTLTANVAAVESEYSAVTSNYNSLTTIVSTLSTKLASDESTISSLNAQINTNTNSIVTVLGQMKDGSTGGNWSITSMPRANLYNLRQDVDTATSSILTEKNQRAIADTAILTELASTSSSASGGKMIGISSTGQFTGKTVEDALKELAGTNRTTETVYGISQSISSLQTANSTNLSTFSMVEDGGAGTWTTAHAQNDGWNIASLKSDVTTNTSNIATLNTQLITLSTTVGNNVTTLTDSIAQIYTDFASTAEAKGSSLVGFYNGTSFSSTTVKDAIYELAGNGRNASMTVAGNYTTLQSHTESINNVKTTVASLNSSVASIISNIGLMMDGGTGSTWSSIYNLVSQGGKISTLETSASEMSSTLDNHTLSIDDLSSKVSTLTTNLTTETTSRQYADNLFKSTTSSSGAMLIGIYDSANHFTSSNVEGALAELSTTLGALSSSLAWLDAVATYNDLPITGNNIGDARTVMSDTDGHQSQYVCVAVTGAIADQWKKIADIDWGNATAISYNNETSGLDATNVNSAIDEVYERTKDPSKVIKEISATDWAASDEKYSITINHELGTTNVTAMVIDTDTGMVVGVDNIERTDANNIKITASNSFNAIVTVFGVVDRFSTITNTWIPEGSGKYYHDFSHNFNTKGIMVSVFDVNDGTMIGVDNIEIIDTNTVRVHVMDNTVCANIFITKNIQTSTVKDISSWTLSGGKYIAVVPSGYGFDAVYTFFDVSTGKTETIDTVKIDGGLLKLIKSNNDTIRLVIVQ